MPRRLTGESQTSEHQDFISLEHWLATEFNRTYDKQVEILSKLRDRDDQKLLEILPESGEIGIRGIDGKAYPLPTKEQIEQIIKEDREIYETKIKQGFTKIQLTPFAIPLECQVPLF